MNNLNSQQALSLQMQMLYQLYLLQLALLYQLLLANRRTSHLCMDAEEIERLAPSNLTLLPAKLLHQRCTGGKKEKVTYLLFVYSCGSSHVPNEYQSAGTTRLYDGLPSGTHYYSNDHLGSSTLITDESGNEVIRTKYTPYGEIDLIHTGKYDPNTNTLTKNAETDPEYSVLGVRFTDQKYDPESSLYYYNARYYDPSIGVFTTADIYVDGPYNYSGYNRYMYVGGNPVRYTDPTGHCWIFCWLIGGASGGRIGQGGYIPVPQQVSALEQGVMKAAWLGVAAVTGGGLGGFVSGILGGGFLGGVVGGFAGGFTSGFISGFGITGDIGQALLGGLLGGSIGALTGGLSYLLSDSGNGGTLLADYCGNCNGKALPDFDSLSGGLVVSDATYGIPAAEALQNAITKTSTAFGSLGGASGLLGGLANFLFPPPPTVNGQPVNMMGMPDWMGIGGPIGKIGGGISWIRNFFRARSLLNSVSKKSLKHISHHLSSFRSLNPKMNIQDVLKLGSKIAADPKNQIGTRTFQKAIDFGGNRVPVRVYLNPKNKIRTIYPLGY